MPERSLLREQVVNTTTWDPDELVTQLRAANQRVIDQPQRDDRWGFVWMLGQSDHEQPPLLIVGVRGEVGALVWWEDADTGFVPAEGLNNADADNYTTTDSHHFGQPRGAELAIEQVYRAVREYVTTGQRPTLEWRQHGWD